MGDLKCFLFLLPLISAKVFYSPEKLLQKSEALPYGRKLRAVLQGSVPNSVEGFSQDLKWWHSISRNNTIDCKCGQFSVSNNNTDRWAEEGITSLNEYSWSVSLVSPGESYAYCGGSLVNDRYVLTAASCVDGSIASGVEVLIGTWPRAHISIPEDEPDQLSLKTLIRKKVSRVIIHPKYSSDHLDNNIALLRLLGPVPTFSQPDGVSPVCLPDPSDNYDGQNSSSLVWRFASDDETIIPIKRTEIASSIISKEECRGLKYKDGWEKMPDSMMCARAERPPDDHPYSSTFDCPGDAGSPLMVTSESGKKVQVGIDSWTACFGRPDGVGVYTRLTEFIPWINLHISKDGRHCAY